MMGIAGIGCLTAGIAVTIFNKAVTGGARNWAARTAWLLIGTALGIYVYGAVTGMLYSLEAGVVSGQSSRGGSATFHRDEHPVLYWVTFLALTCGTGVLAFFSLMCFWKAIKKG
nr:hypothetical protein [Dyella sp. ASV24]